LNAFYPGRTIGQELQPRERGQQILESLTWNAVHELNARHALENDAVTKEAALDLHRRNSAAAAAAIRALSDEELARAAAWLMVRGASPRSVAELVGARSRSPGEHLSQAFQFSRRLLQHGGKSRRPHAWAIL
jgi:hypothetical protein